MVPISAVLFDLDGTLIDSQEDITASVNEVRVHCGLPPYPTTEVADMVGLGIRVLLRRAMGEESVLPLDDAVRQFRAHYREHCLDRTRLFDGVIETLEALSPLSLGVVSNKPVEFSRKILEGLGVASRFVVIVGGDSTPEKKPHPEPVYFALREMNSLPAEAIFVGDSPVDVNAARRAGVRTCGVTYGLASAEELREAGPSHLIHRITELPAVVRHDGVGPPAAVG